MSGSQNRKPNPSLSKSQEEAAKIARATQKPGQTKEQTRLIAQGIQKGIEQYKKQHKAKLRDLDKQKKKKIQNAPVMDIPSDNQSPDIVYKQHMLPWGLLIASWVGFAAYFVWF